MSLVSLKAAILKTLAYSDNFSFPLTSQEILVRLIQEKADKVQVDAVLKDLLVRKQVMQKGEYYYVPGRAALVEQRLKRAKVSAREITHAKLVAEKLKHVPGILGIYLTGSLAVKNSDEGDDLDLLIVTDNHRLWTTRCLLTLYCELLGLRRRPDTQAVAGKVCLNLYLTPKAFALPESKRSLYTAYELIQVLPLSDPHGLYGNLLEANGWVHKYLPNVPFPEGATILPRFNRLGNLETLLYRFQTWYMQGKRTTEYVTHDVAFFHPANPGTSVLKKLSLDT